MVGDVRQEGNHNVVYPLVPQKVFVQRADQKYSGVPVEPRLVVRPSRNTLMVFRESQRWCKEGANVSTEVRAMPFITREGYISSNAVYYWRCSSIQWVASVTATVFQRLKERWYRLRIRGDKVLPNRDLLMRIAAMYTLTQDSGFLVRTVECAKRNEGAARKLVYKMSRKVDDLTRFWYGQLTSQGVTLWLQLRGQKPRDKSTNFLLSDFRLIDITVGRSEIRQQNNWLKAYTDPWIRTRQQAKLPYLIPLRGGEVGTKVSVPLTRLERGVFGVRQAVPSTRRRVA